MFFVEELLRGRTGPHLSAVVIFLRQELFFYISPILQTLLRRKMSHNVTIDRSGRVFSPVSEKMPQLIETNSSLANKRTNNALEI